MLVTSAIDALVHVRTSTSKGLGTGKQFTDRTGQIAAELAIPFTREDAQEVWKHRSDIAHGRDPWESRRNAKGDLQQSPELTKNDPMVRRCLTSEQILRSVILKCLTDTEYAGRFECDECVENAYPVTRATAKKPRINPGNQASS
jgi:hypothetical protein